MGSRQLTPAEERAYRALARAARDLQEAQQAAGRERETKRVTAPRRQRQGAQR
jgi:hypothetical protein